MPLLAPYRLADVYSLYSAIYLDCWIAQPTVFGLILENYSFALAIAKTQLNPINGKPWSRCGEKGERKRPHNIVKDNLARNQRQ